VNNTLFRNGRNGVRLVENDKEDLKREIDLVPDEDKGDIIMLRLVLRSVTEFVKDIKEPLKELFKALAETLEGGKIGKDVAEFYENLKKSGVPEDMAKEMTMEYFKKRMEISNILTSIPSLLGGKKGVGLSDLLSKVKKLEEEESEEEKE
jgi:hypothetical protein